MTAGPSHDSILTSVDCEMLQFFAFYESYSAQVSQVSLLGQISAQFHHKLCEGRHWHVISSEHEKGAEFLNPTELKFSGKSTNTILLMYMYMAVQKASLVSLGTFTSNAS